MEFSELLELRKETALESPSDRLFYQNVHAYIKVIMDDPKARSIIENAEREYSEGHYNIWQHRTNDENVIDERARSTYKFERFNLYAANFVNLFVRIYLPIEDFITSDEPASRQHPVAIVALYGLNGGFAKEWCNGLQTMPPKEAKKQLKSYSRWFENRKEYVDDLVQFHADFLTTYYKVGDVKQTKIKTANIPLRLNYSTGDFSYNGVAGNLNPTGQEYKALVTLLSKPDHLATYLEIIKSYRPKVEEPSKAHKNDMYKVINNLKKHLGISEDDETGVIQNVKKLGYRLIFKDDAIKRD